MSIVQYPPGYLDEYRGRTPVAVAIAFLIMETLCVILRFYARRIGKVPWGADDTLILPGFIFCAALCACTIAIVVDGGVGHHEAALALTDPEKLFIGGKFLLVVLLLYLAAVVFPKLAILAIYLRIFVQPRFRATCYILAMLLIANWVGNTVAGLLMCKPLHYLWDQTITGDNLTSGHCFHVNVWMCWASLINIVTDVAMLVLPLPVIWKLHTSRSIKIGLTITFATGSVGLITSIIRFANFFKNNAEVDGSYSAVDLAIWTTCESGSYLIAACLPTYKPLARPLWKDGSLISRLVSGTREFLGSKLTGIVKRSRSSHLQFENDSITFPLQNHRVSNFKRLRNEADDLDSFPKFASTVSNAERGDIDGSKIQKGILVKHDVDVRGTKVDNRSSGVL